MREEHERHLQNLKNLHIQQDMQAFNDLKDNSNRKRIKTTETLSSGSIRPNILKTSFLRPSLPPLEDNGPDQEFRQSYYKHPMTTSFVKGRPETSGSGMFRQNAPMGSEHVIPNLDRIVRNFEAVKVLDGPPESRARNLRNELEEHKSVQGLKESRILNESPHRLNFASQQSQRVKEQRPITQQSEKEFLVPESENLVEALEKHDENIKFLAL